jgi:ATP-dependent Clp protease ATP-binding subunit ClpA
MAQIPPKQVSTDDKAGLKTSRRISTRWSSASRSAIEQVATAIKLSRAGLREPREAHRLLPLHRPHRRRQDRARQAAREDAGHRLPALRHVASTWSATPSRRLIGAPPGYVGFDKGGILTEAINKTPHAVLLLDEIEKAHPDIFNILLQVMDHGTLTDNNGKPADFRHVVLIMTSNVGARDLARRPDRLRRQRQRGRRRRAYKNTFSPEFRNRLDARIAFLPLQPESMEKIVAKFIRELEAQLADRKITLEITDRAKAWLGEKGYDKVLGARPLQRVIRDEVKRPLTEEILFGALEHGGHAIIDPWCWPTALLDMPDG